jgi:hypothetical protein
MSERARHEPAAPRQPRRSRIADSILLGGVAFLIAATGMTVLIISGWRSAEDLPATVALSSLCGGPLLAVVNLYFVLRDRERGRGDQAMVGALLSGGTILLGVIPWMGVD